MHHDVFYLGKILLYRIMHPFRDAVRLPERLAAVHPYLDIHIDLIAKNPRMQKVYALHTVLPGGALLNAFSTSSLQALSTILFTASIKIS